MMNKKASVAKMIALAVVPLSLMVVVTKVAQQRRVRIAAGATKRLLIAMNSAGLHLSTLELEQLIAEGADVNVRSTDGSTPLHHASQTPSTDCRILIDNGANVNARDRYGTTPLMISASGTDVETVRLLLSHGADPNIKAGLRFDGQPSTALSQVRDRIRDVSRECQEHPAYKHQSDVIWHNKRYPEIIQMLKAAGAKE